MGAMRLRSILGAAGALAIGLASTASAQLVVGNDQFRSTTTGVGEPPTIWLVDVNGGSAPRALVSGTAAGLGGTPEAWGLAADDAAGRLFWNTGTLLRSAAYAPSGELTPVDVGPITFVGTGTQTIASVTGLSFTGWTLVGYKSTSSGTAFPVGFYTINPTTATATLLAAAPSTDFGALDFDAATNTFYGANDTTST